MATVVVRVPGLLARFTGGEQRVSLDASTVRGAVEGLIERYPDLEPHLFDDRGELRTHLQVFDDEGQVAWAMAGERSVGNDSEIVVLQAVSGG